MEPCCPAGSGCNAPRGQEDCALALLSRSATLPEAATALARWKLFEDACQSSRRESERRFRRRAYQRARDRALITLALQWGTAAHHSERGHADEQAPVKGKRLGRRARRTRRTPRFRARPIGASGH